MNMVQRMVVLFVLVCFTGGCSQQQMEEAGEAAKQATEGVQSAATDAAEAAGDVAGQVKEAASEGLAAASEKAASALSQVEGGGELLQQVKDFFGSAQSSLQGITDGETANAALTQLNSLSSSLDGWPSLLDKLPAEAKSAVQGVIVQGKTALQSVSDKVLALPGVSDVVKPKLDELMNKLQSFTE